MTLRDPIGDKERARIEVALRVEGEHTAAEYAERGGWIVPPADVRLRVGDTVLLFDREYCFAYLSVAHVASDGVLLGPREKP